MGFLLHAFLRKHASKLSSVSTGNMATAVEKSNAGAVQGEGRGGGNSKIDDEENRMEQQHWTSYMEKVVKESQKSLDQQFLDRDLSKLIKSADAIRRQTLMYHEYAYGTEKVTTKFVYLGNYYALMLRYIELVFEKMKNHPSYKNRSPLICDLG